MRNVQEERQVQTENRTNEFLSKLLKTNYKKDMDQDCTICMEKFEEN